MKLSVVVPTYNEEKTIIQILKKINSVKIDKEVIVVDDGSSDNTFELLKANKNLYDKLISKRNGGKGSAIRLGFKKCTGDVVIVQDADLEYDPNDYHKLIKPIINGKSYVVYGSRFKNQKKMNNWGIPLHYIGNKMLSLVFSVLFFSYISDMETCYKCMSIKVVRKLRLKENDFRIEPEITSQIIKKRYQIVEVPINYHHRSFNEGKKINWKDGVKAFLAIVKYRLS